MSASSAARVGGGKLRSSERASVQSPAGRSRFPAIGPASTAAAAAPAAPPPLRSFRSVVLATAHPLPSPPIKFAAGTRTSVRNTSLNSARPVISRIGRISTPRWSTSTMK